MFVPSLSWQNDHSVQNGAKRRVSFLTKHGRRYLIPMIPTLRCQSWACETTKHDCSEYSFLVCVLSLSWQNDQLCMKIVVSRTATSSTSVSMTAFFCVDATHTSSLPLDHLNSSVAVGGCVGTVDLQMLAMLYRAIMKLS